MVWALAKVKDSFELFGGDKVDSYLLFSNPHQYGKSIDVRFTPIRVVCNNTLSMSLGMEADKSVRVGHRVEFDADAVTLVEEDTVFIAIALDAAEDEDDAPIEVSFIFISCEVVKAFVDTNPDVTIVLESISLKPK